MSNQHNYPLIGQAFLGSKPLSASATLTGTDSGKGFSNAPATAAITVSLPKSKPGLTYQFLEVVAHNIVVTPVTGDTVRGLAASASYTLNAVGQLLVLECITPGFWEVVNIPGSPGGIIIGGVSSVTGTANQVTATPTTGAVVVSLPLNIILPNNSANTALTLQNADKIAWKDSGGVTRVVLQLFSDNDIYLDNNAGGGIHIRPNATVSSAIDIAHGGNVTINAPTSGGGLVVNPNSSELAIQCTFGSDTGQFFIGSGFFQVGAASATTLSLFANNVNYINLFPTGGLTLGVPAPTGGNLGNGNMNVSGGYFVNGVAVGNPITSNHVSTAVPFASTTALAVVPQLTTASLAAGTYAFEAVLLVSEVTSSAGGIKFDFGAGSASVTPFAATGINVISNTYAPGTVIPITTVSIVAANPSIFIIKGTTTLTSAGTFGMRAAQNTSSANTTSIAVGSYIKLTKIT